MSERACIWAWVLIIPSSLHFAAVIFSFKDCCQFLSGRLRGAGFSGGGLRADSAGGNRTKKHRGDSRDGDFSVSGRRFYFGNITVREDLGC